MTPLGHVGITLPVARALRLNMWVVLFTALLPDIVDKTMWWLGLGAPRYVGHSLLFLALVVFLFSLRGKRGSLAALLGGGSHLLLDSGEFVPWFFPFVSYSFLHREFDPSMFFSNLLDSFRVYGSHIRMGHELIWVAAAVVAAIVLPWLYSRVMKRWEQKG